MMKHISLKYNSEQVDASAVAILHAFDAEWKLGSISIKRFSEGKMNTVCLRPLVVIHFDS